MKPTPDPDGTQAFPETSEELALLQEDPAGKGAVVAGAGDCVFSLAAQHGVRWEDLWQLPSNSNLRETRKYPGQLQPGDRITLPERSTRSISLREGETHRIVVKPLMMPVRLRLLHEGTAWANTPCAVYALGKTYPGRSDGEGNVEFSVPADVRGAVLRIEAGNGRTIDCALEFGALRPLRTRRGLQTRLANLAYYGGPVDGRLNAETRRALAAFQRDQGLGVTGTITQDTLTKLASVHDGTD